VLFLLGAVLTGVSAARAEVPDEPGSGRLLLQRQGITQAALHLESSADVTIKGMLAKVVLQQTFQNTGHDWAEAVYVFPLPETAAVKRMVMTIGERRLVAEIREKQAAQRIYQEAKTSGKRAALTEQQRPNLFTQSVANIGPGEIVTIELHFHDVVDYRDGIFRWRLPTTLTPRYIPGAPSDDPDLRTTVRNGWSLPTEQVRDAHLITPPMVPSTGDIQNPLRLHITLDTGLALIDIGSPYHQLLPTIKNLGSSTYHDIVTHPAQVPMDRDFELSWRTQSGDEPTAALFVEEVADDDYALLMVVPPQQQLSQRLPREVIFIIDTSGANR
jgi:Ca-activated chloride channel family protein